MIRMFFFLLVQEGTFQIKDLSLVSWKKKEVGVDVGQRECQGEFPVSEA